jgi:hypothetical protein
MIHRPVQSFLDVLSRNPERIRVDLGGYSSSE